MARIQKDASAKVTKALPNAANTVNTNGIDLGATTPFPLTEVMEVQLSITQCTGANNKNINIAVQDSADNSTFTNIAELATFVNQANTANFAAASRTVTLPPATRRYIRASAVGEANGGDASDGTLTVQLLF